MKKGNLGLGLKLSLPQTDQVAFAKFLTESGTFKDGDLLVNRDGVRIVSQTEVEAPPPNPIKPTDNQLSLADIDIVKVVGKGNGGMVLLLNFCIAIHFLKNTYIMAEPVKDIPVGHLGNLTPDQENALKAVKTIENLPERYDDLMLLRFLRARQFDAAKTSEMIKNDIEWRKKMGADTALESWPKTKWYKQCLDYWPSAFHGVDRFGNPVYFERLGNIDPKSFVGSVPQEDLVQYHIWAMERIEAKMREGYKNGTVHASAVDLGVLYVEDMGGFGMRHFNKAGLNMVQMLSAIDQDHYPETLRKVIAINVPSLFSAVWKIVSPWLDPITQGKIDLLGSSGYMNALTSEGLTPETIPTFITGSKCTSCNGNCMPSGGVFGDLPDTCSVANVNAGSNFEKSVKIEKADSVLSYRFKVAEYNIGFSIALEENGKRKELVAYNKFENEPVQGEFTVPVPGTYVFLWDNSFSMWRKKVVKYEVEVLEPTASEQQ